MEFRRALALFATGVTVVTTHHDGVDVGVTANSFSSVSLDPPLILWSLAKRSSSIAAFRRAEFFAVNLLSIAQRSISNSFARSGLAPGEKFSGVEITRGIGNTPLLEGCSARFECQTMHQYEAGDHVIFVGKVSRFERWNRTPLVFLSGEYGIAARAQFDACAARQGDVGAEPTWDSDALSYPLSRVYLQFTLAQTAPLKAVGIEDRLEFAILAALLVKGEASVDDVRNLFFYTSRPISDAVIDALQRRKLIDLDSLKGLMRLTLEGHHSIVRAIAAEQEWESSALEPLTHGEAIVLKQLLRKVMRATDQNSIPTPWS